VLLHESDIQITAESDLTYRACGTLHRARKEIEDYIGQNPGFLSAMGPVERNTAAPEIANRMMNAAAAWETGPMAAVAGAIAEAVGVSLSDSSDTVIVENGGDIYAIAEETINCALYAGEESPFAGHIGFSIDASEGFGICTSSGIVGPSFSRGIANAVTVIARDCSVADAAATAIANRIHSPADIEPLLGDLEGICGLTGVIACCGGKLASWGVNLFRIDLRKEGGNDIEKRNA